jgi:succinoglycan biosynthesis protein ExoV
MKLQYHKGKNFGDELNPLIWNHFLPDYFKGHEEVNFLGIGSILGLAGKYPGKKVVFSSGYGDGAKSTYGSLPTDRQDYDIICVRGPLTAQLLNLPDSQWVTDGAILLADMPLSFIPNPKYISFMPHVGSMVFYDHQKMCDELGWNFIDPTSGIEEVIFQMSQSTVVVTEAMHGAIVADTLRIPWIPYAGYNTINAFKWQDWCASMQMNYEPLKLRPFYSVEKSKSLLENKLKSKGMVFLLPMLFPILNLIMGMNWRYNKRKLKAIANVRSSKLSRDDVFNDRLQCMKQKIEEFKSKYPIENYG